MAIAAEFFRRIGGGERLTWTGDGVNEARTDEVTEERRPGWWRRRWFLITTGVLFAVAIVVALTVVWGLRQLQPTLRRKVVDTLSARFHSPVELDRLQVSMRNGIIVTGGGLRILYLAGPTKPDARPNAPPMLEVDRFEFRTGWRELLRPTTRLVTVKVRGLQVNIPPKEERGAAMPDDPKRRGQRAVAGGGDDGFCGWAQCLCCWRLWARLRLNGRCGRCNR